MSSEPFMSYHNADLLPVSKAVWVEIFLYSPNLTMLACFSPLVAPLVSNTRLALLKIYG